AHSLNARRTMEAAGLHAAPKFGTLATSPDPLGVEPRQMRIQRAEPDPEDVGPVTSNYFTHKSAAITRQADDLLYRNAVLGECQDGGVGLLTPEIAFVLEPLRAGEQLRIDCRCSDRHPDRTHGLAHGVKKRRARVLDQIPAVGDMDSMGQRLGHRLTISSAPVPRNNLDLRMSREPSLDGCDFPIWQKRHDSSALQIANDRPIAMISAECPVVEANHAQRTGIRAGASAH